MVREACVRATGEKILSQPDRGVKGVGVGVVVVVVVVIVVVVVFVGVVVVAAARMWSSITVSCLMAANIDNLAE